MAYTYITDYHIPVPVSFINRHNKLSIRDRYQVQLFLAYVGKHMNLRIIFVESIEECGVDFA